MKILELVVRIVVGIVVRTRIFVYFLSLSENEIIELTRVFI